MKIGYLGSGMWSYTLAELLASIGHSVECWSIEQGVIDYFNATRSHPKLPQRQAPDQLAMTSDLIAVLSGKDLIVEGVTAAGIRPVFEQIKKHEVSLCPIVLTSKGIEQNTGLLLTNVVISVLGESYRKQIGCLSGPSIALEVFERLPAAVVCSAYDETVMHLIHKAFSCETFRVYPNSDIYGVELGGAMKNIIAIACGVADGLGFGDNTKALLMTRGLHEIRRLAPVCGCRPETLNGLAGMGDLCVTCLSTHSRNYRFGRLIAEGKGPEEAKQEIGMVVEGAYSCLSAVQIAKKAQIELPIADAVYRIVYEALSPKEAVKLLLKRRTKQELL